MLPTGVPLRCGNRLAMEAYRLSGPGTAHDNALDNWLGHVGQSMCAGGESPRPLRLDGPSTIQALSISGTSTRPSDAPG